MTWQLLVLINVFGFAAVPLLLRKLMSSGKVDPIASSAVFQIVSGVFLLVWSVVNGIGNTDYSKLIPNLILMVVIYSVSNILTFRALKTVEASDYTIISATKSVWIMVAAVVLFSERVTLVQVLGVILITAAAILVSLPNKKDSSTKSIKFTRNHFLLVINAVILAIGFTNDTQIVSSVDQNFYGFLAFTLPGLAMFVYQPSALGKLSSLANRKVMPYLLLSSFLLSIAFITIYAAYKAGGLASQIGPISQSSIILTVLLSMIFLGERDRLRPKLLATLVVILGVLLLN